MARSYVSGQPCARDAYAGNGMGRHLLTQPDRVRLTVTCSIGRAMLVEQFVRQIDHPIFRDARSSVERRFGAKVEFQRRVRHFDDQRDGTGGHGSVAGRFAREQDIGLRRAVRRHVDRHFRQYLEV